MPPRAKDTQSKEYIVQTSRMDPQGSVASSFNTASSNNGDRNMPPATLSRDKEIRDFSQPQAETQTQNSGLMMHKISQNLPADRDVFNAKTAALPSGVRRAPSLSDVYGNFSTGSGADTNGSRQKLHGFDADAPSISRQTSRDILFSDNVKDARDKDLPVKGTTAKDTPPSPRVPLKSARSRNDLSSTSPPDDFDGRPKASLFSKLSDKLRGRKSPQSPPDDASVQVPMRLKDSRRVPDDSHPKLQSIGVGPVSSLSTGSSLSPCDDVPRLKVSKSRLSDMQDWVHSCSIWVPSLDADSKPKALLSSMFKGKKDQKDSFTSPSAASSNGQWVATTAVLSNDGILRIGGNLVVIDVPEQLLRRCIVPLSPSVLGQDNCVALYKVSPQPIYLSFLTQAHLNRWLLTMTFLSQPEFARGIGASGSYSLARTLQIARSLKLTLVDASFPAQLALDKNNKGRSPFNARVAPAGEPNVGLSCQLSVDDHVFAHSSVKYGSRSVFWRETFETPVPSFDTLNLSLTVYLHPDASKKVSLGVFPVTLPSLSEMQTRPNDVRVLIPIQSSEPESSGSMSLLLIAEASEIAVLPRLEYDSFVSSIAQDNSNVILKSLIADTGSNDAISPFVKILIHENVFFDHYSTLLDDELATATSSTLFRGNSLLTKVVDAYTHIVAHDFLVQTWGPDLAYFVRSGLEIEVDPARLASGVSPNTASLRECASRLFNRVMASLPACPSGLIYLLRLTHSRVTAALGPDAARSALVALFFLRFFVPSIINVKNVDVLQSPSPGTQRSLILIAKTIQGLANQSSFGSKEPFMEPLNEFISAYTGHLSDVIDYITFNAPLPSLILHDSRIFGHTSISCILSESQDDVVSETGLPLVTRSFFDVPQTLRDALPDIFLESAPSIPYAINIPLELASLVDYISKHAPWLPHAPVSENTLSRDPVYVRFLSSVSLLIQETQLRLEALDDNPPSVPPTISSQLQSPIEHSPTKSLSTSPPPPSKAGLPFPTTSTPKKTHYSPEQLVSPTKNKLS